ncbi:MAG TPA: esterase-like activity of phytase family protein [Allosphingosinicella sp.]|nr:esterase-like activity of phytase family protein [Allosphingosinicella sp.]
MTGWSVERLDWTDEALGEIELPERTMRFRSSFGSGLSRRAGDPPGIVWAVGDRGPNIKVKTAVKLYGLDRLKPLRNEAGAKIMPRLDLGPALAELRLTEGRVELVRSLRIGDSQGRPVSGLPVPAGPHTRCEPAFDLAGEPLEPDPSGLDTEGIAQLPDGGFWVSDEFGPSLVRLDSGGRILKRLVPEGTRLDGAAYPVEACLPAIAARRQLNRGFEAITLSADGQWLFLAFQSPLAHPDEAAHAQARHVRLWRLDAATGEVAAQYLYPLDPPSAFRRDQEKGALERSDLKISELCWVGMESLLVLERGSESTKIYRVTPDDSSRLPGEHLDDDARPTVEELSARPDGPGLPVLTKHLLFDTDEATEIGADLEGMAILSPCELLLVSDNDFGVEGAETGFWRVRFDSDFLA